MDSKRKLRIGINLTYNSNWLGGVYYIKNIIFALNSLEETNKPYLIFFYTDASKSYIDDIIYPYIDFVKYMPRHKYLGYLYSWVLRKNVYIFDIVKEYDLDGLFPINDVPISCNTGKTKIVSWYPDLQHKFYPLYFTKLGLLFREWRIKLLLRNTQHLILSSKDVQGHFEKFYKMPSSLSITVLPFVSNVQKSELDIDFIRLKYGVAGKYFIVSNQFYEHKNHKVVLEAISELKNDNENVLVVFTGKFEDYKNPKYVDSLKKLIHDTNIDNNVKILGIIPRDEQICLLQNSLAIIQPSLFEGWSTIVEDAKTLQLPIITSNIPVHCEQLGSKGIFFDPLNSSSLSLQMMKFIKNTEFYEYNGNYAETLNKFATDFINIFK